MAPLYCQHRQNAAPFSRDAGSGSQYLLELWGHFKMFMQWVSRCLPGFSIIALLVLLRLTSADLLPFWPWTGPVHGLPGDKPKPLGLAQKTFIFYTVLVHFCMFAFTTRLAWSLWTVTRETKRALARRPSSKASRLSLESGADKLTDGTITPSEEGSVSSISDDSTLLEMDKPTEVIHAIIIPNYSEDVHTLRTTLDVLASHPRARTQYEVGLTHILIRSFIGHPDANKTRST